MIIEPEELSAEQAARVCYVRGLRIQEAISAIEEQSAVAVLWILSDATAGELEAIEAERGRQRRAESRRNSQVSSGLTVNGDPYYDPGWVVDTDAPKG